MINELGTAGQGLVCPGKTERVEKVVYVSWSLNEKWMRYIYHSNFIIAMQSNTSRRRNHPLAASFTASNYLRCMQVDWIDSERDCIEPLMKENASVFIWQSDGMSAIAEHH